MNAEQKLYEIECWLIQAARDNDPQVFKARFAALIANVVGNMSEDYWLEFVKVEPCGRAGCDCHLGVQKSGTDLFKILREDHQQYSIDGGHTVTE